MKASRNKKRMIITIVVAALAIVAAILVFDNQQKKAATETRAEEQQTATPTPTPTTTDDEPGSLYYEETVRFNNVDLIKKDIPEWLIDAIEKDDPVVVARTIAERVTRTNLEDFGVRTIYGKDPIGFYCWNDGYIEKEGDKILIGDEVYVYLDEPTVPLIIPEEKKFGFVETLINFLWKRDCKCFWTAGYEHFIEVKEVPFPIEKEPAICVDGEFLSIMPDTEEPDENGPTHKYADGLDGLSRGLVWYSDETFYCVKSHNSMLYRWKWSPDVGEGWERTGVVPTLPSDMVIATAWPSAHCWYLVGKGNTVIMYETFKTSGEFGIRPVLKLKFKGVGIARPFVIHEGNEGGWETAFIAVPEKNSLWKIDRRGIYKARPELLEVTEEKIVAQDNGIIEVLAQHEEDGLYGSWVGDYVKMTNELRYQESVAFEEKTRRVRTEGRMKIEGGEIVIGFDDAEITLLT